MKAVMQWGSGLAALLLFVSTSHAYNWASPVFKWPIPVAPDACGPGWYTVGPCGMVYGPHHYVVPPWMPFNGLLPGPAGQHLMAARSGVPPWMMQGAGAGAGTMAGPATPLPPYPMMAPVPPYAVGTPMPPATPMGPGTPVPPNAPVPPVPDNRVHTGIYPTHPYIRSPRDFFMWNEAMEDLRGQDIRPTLVIPR